MFPRLRNFAWQEGYGAFSIGVSGIEETRFYITNQEEHHRSRTYRQEVIMFLERHRLPFDHAMLDGGGILTNLLGEKSAMPTRIGRPV
jgi:hypothetical protein